MIDEEHIVLAHGNGGRRMRQLIEQVFARHLGNPDSDQRLDVTLDAAPIGVLEGAEYLMSTDAFTVQPLEFPGGNIGSLAVHGTVNDLAVAGARPLYLTLNAIIEEGLEAACLDRIVASLAMAAREAGVQVVAGDTKVVPRGHGGGLYLVTTGVGIKSTSVDLCMQAIEPGDVIIVSGPVGDHGISVMLAREDFDIQGEVRSDSASVLPLTRSVEDLDGLRFMRDPTRGGLATVAHELATLTGLQLRLSEADTPVREPVRMVCEMLGYDPYYLACEGRVVAIVEKSQSTELLSRWRQTQAGAEAAIIGTVCEGAARVVLETEIGGERILEELEDDPLPRIC